MANDPTTMVHVTHEAGDKIGGIGAVLNGFFTCRPYLDSVERSILVGPLFNSEVPVSELLGKDGEVLYSSANGYENTEYAPAFRMIENFYNAGIVYGTRSFIDKETGIKSSPEVLLVDVRYLFDGPINDFKGRLYKEFGIESNSYEHIWECEQYVRLAPVAIAALKEIGAAHDSTMIISHEFMGMATALAGILEPCCNFKTSFYAHEVATIRRIIEEHSGHDIMFYNALRCAVKKNLYVDDVFGEQNTYFKHAFVAASKYCDSICAVGDYVLDELKFLGPEFENANINVVYNGIPAYKISIDEKVKSKEKLQKYCKTLLGYKPDFVFTHVTRLVQSKGLWRDLYILEHMEKEFRTQHKTAVMFLLSTQAAKRANLEITKMEDEYNWPVAHREGLPDLTGGEAEFYASIQEFNAKSRNIKVVFINQFGFDRESCGKRMPKDMEFMDIRQGSDVEFGLSVYEPFGIAQLEPLSFGGICVISEVCGCAGFVKDITNGDGTKNVIITDYTDLDKIYANNITDSLDIGLAKRKVIEENISKQVAMQICSRLAHKPSEIEELLAEGYDLAAKMSWDRVVGSYLLPSLEKILHKEAASSMHAKLSV